MQQDPRSKNKLPQSQDIEEFAHDYFKMLFEASSKINVANLNDALKVLEGTINAGQCVYVAGNGGSAAISDHLCCDWTKGTSHSAFKTLKTHSLTASTALVTALANDQTYDDIFAKQLEYYCTAKDVVILISSSGNSPNILKGMAAAKKIGAKVIGMSGFEGGQLKKGCDISLHVPEHNYGVVEDCHQSLMHIIAQFIARGRDAKK